MLGKFEVLNGTTKVTFEVTAETQLVIDVVTTCAHYLWDHGFGEHGTLEAPVAFEDLTNQDKLDLVANHVQAVILDLANSYKSNKAQETARATEEANEYQF